MGYAVLHMEKTSGTDAAMSAHIERTIKPKNADESRTHLNRELITFPDGVENRTQSIQHRLDTAGLTRKIGNNQVRAIRVLLTGTHEDMERITNEGRLDEWCDDNLKYLADTFGRENIVSAVLHMDEQTPHLHATVIPIVTGERRKAKREQQDGKKKYRKKNPQAARLCADDVMTQKNLKRFQDTYAEAMGKYGLKRGVDGSEARHISTAQYYKELIEQQGSLQENIGNLLQLEEEAQKKLKQVKGEINTQKMKSAAVNATTAIADGVSSLLGGSKVKRLEAENGQLKQDIADLQERVKAEQAEQKNMEHRHCSEINKIYRAHQQETIQYDERLKRIDTYFPHVKELLPIADQCREMGFTEEMTRQLVCFKPVGFRGKLYSREHGKEFKTEHSMATIEKNPQQTGKFRLCIDGMPILEWFKMKFQELKEKLGVGHTPKEENKPKRGFRI